MNTRPANSVHFCENFSGTLFVKESSGGGHENPVHIAASFEGRKRLLGSRFARRNRSAAVVRGGIVQGSGGGGTSSSSVTSVQPPGPPMVGSEASGSDAEGGERRTAFRFFGGACLHFRSECDILPPQSTVHRFLRLMVPLLWGVAPRRVQQSLRTAVVVEVKHPLAGLLAINAKFSGALPGRLGRTHVSFT